MTKTSNFIIMGSKSRLGNHAKQLKFLTISAALRKRKLSPLIGHRTLMFKHAEEARSRGIKVIIAGAGGAALARDGCC